MRVLVTGGTGTLGRHVVRALGARAGVAVRVLSRHASTATGTAPTVEWARVDFTTGGGLRDALRAVDVVVHAAHDPRRPARDVAGVRALLQAATEARARLLYVSIVGARDVPGVAYYRGKAEAERLVLASPLGVVFRATQFHGFVDGLLRGLDRLPGVLIVPRGMRFQPVDVREAGEALARHALDAGAAETALAGPEVLDVRTLAESWLRARGRRSRVLELPVPLRSVRAIAGGALTSSTAERGRVTWREWLAARPPDGAPDPG